MLIKNISGKDSYFAIGDRNGRGSRFYRGKFIANNASANFADDDAKALADARRYESEGKVQILTGPAQTAQSGSVTVPASATIKITDTGAANADFVTIKGIKFLYAASAGTVVSPDVWAGAGAVGATAVSTLRTAINAHATLGVKAGATIDDGTDNILPLTAVTGTDIALGSAYTLVKSGAQITVSGATFKNGIAGNAKLVSEFTYVATAADIVDETWIIPTGLVEVGSFTVQVKTALGVVKDISSLTQPTFLVDTTVGSKGNIIVNDTAGNLIAATDLILVRAVGL